MADLFEQHMQKMIQREADLKEQGVLVFRMSATERQEFKECRRRWDFSSYSRQGLEPKRAAVALWFGTGIHHVLEEYYRVEQAAGELPHEAFDIEKSWQAWIDKEFAKLEKQSGELWEAQKAELLDSVSLGRGMVEGYLRWADKADFEGPTSFKKILYTEREFAVEVPGPDGKEFIFKDGNGQPWVIWLVGRMDLIVQDWKDKIWVVDHKTSKDKLDPEILILDDQMTVYMWALQEILGIEIEGCFYNVLRKKLPTIPKLLQNGTTSQDKSCDTTYEVYYDTLIERGQDPAQYENMLQMLQQKDAKFFERVPVHRNQHEIAQAGKMLVMEGIDMLNEPYIYPNPTWDCRWKCDFKNMCLAQNRQDDWQYLRETMFQKRRADEGSVYGRESTIE